MTHPRLSVLSAADKAHEIQESRRTLEQIVGRPVTSFAYPYGQSGDYDAQSVAMVRTGRLHARLRQRAGYRDPAKQSVRTSSIPRFGLER